MNSDVAHIQQEVFAQRPALGEIWKLHGHRTVADYIRHWPVSEPSGMDPLFIRLLGEQAELIYGETVSHQLQNQLARKPLVSTVDHHGIWGHPIFVNADVLYSQHFSADESVVVLSTESVSLNNVSSWSASILHHDSAGSLVRHSLFPDRLKTLPVFSTPAFTRQDVDRWFARMHGDLGRIGERGGFSEYADLPRFSVQASLVTSRLWSAVFPSAPRLFYLPLESLVSEYVLAAAEEQPDHPLMQVVFSGGGQMLWRKYFADDHTFLFWEIDGKGRRQRLAELAESREEILDGLRSRRLYASSPLCFAVLLCAGMTCAGGFTQTTWLTKTKQAFMQLLEGMGEALLAARVSGIPTQNFAESSLAHLRLGDRFLKPTAADLLLSGADHYPVFSQLAQRLTLAQSITAALPTIYSVVVPGADRPSNLDLNLLEAQAIQAAGVLDSFSLKK